MHRGDRRKIIKEIPPRQCSATAKGTGRRCRRLAMIGGTVCPKHGGAAPQVRAAAERRVLIAELLTGPGRPPREVLSDALKVVDGLMRHAVSAATEAGEPLPLDVFDRLVDATSRAAMLAKIGLDQQLETEQDRMRAIGEQTVETLAEVVAALGADAIPGFGAYVQKVLDDLCEGRPPQSRSGATLLERWVTERVEREVARRLDGVKAIAAAPSSPVSGPEVPQSSAGPDAGDDPHPGVILAERGAMDNGSVPAAAPVDEVLDAVIVDEEPARPCPRCGRPLASPMHNPMCPGRAATVLEWAR